VADSTQFHETYSHDDAEEIGSDRSFAITFAVVFGLIAAYFYFFGGPSWMPDSLQSASWYPKTWMGLAGISGAFLVVGFTVPSILHPFNVVWMKFAMVLNMIVSPIVMGLLFFLTVTPMAILVRIMGKDLLRLRLEKDAKSYWIERDPPGPPPESIKNQF
jgi:hypothetical protein